MNFAKTFLIAVVAILSVNITFANDNFTIQVNDAKTELTVNSNFDGITNKQTITDASAMKFFQKFGYISVESTSSDCSIEVAINDEIKIYQFDVSFDEFKTIIDLSHIDFSNLDVEKMKQYDFSSTKEKYKMLKSEAIASKKVVDGNKTIIDVTLPK